MGKAGCASKYLRFDWIAGVANVLIFLISFFLLVLGTFAVSVEVVLCSATGRLQRLRMIPFFKLLNRTDFKRKTEGIVQLLSVFKGVGEVTV